MRRVVKILGMDRNTTGKVSSRDRSGVQVGRGLKWGGPCKHICRQGWALGWWAKHTERGKFLDSSIDNPTKSTNSFVVCAYAADASAFFQCAG